MSGPFLCTTMQRRDAEGGVVDCDVIIYFTVTSYTPGSPAVLYQRNGDPGWPAEDAEWEFEFDRAEFDGGEPSDAPGPLTDAEVATLREWFAQNHDLAGAVAADGCLPAGPDPDEAYERMRDEQMERGL